MNTCELIGFYQKEKQTFTTGNKFCALELVPTEIRSCPSTELGGVILGVYIQRAVLRSQVRKTFLGPKAEFSKQFIYISKTGESADFLFSPKFSKNSLRKRRGGKSLPWLSSGRNKLIFNLCLIFSQPSHLYRDLLFRVDVMIRERCPAKWWTQAYLHPLQVTQVLPQDLMTRSGPLPARKALHPSALLQWFPVPSNSAPHRNFLKDSSPAPTPQPTAVCTLVSVLCVHHHGHTLDHSLLELSSPRLCHTVICRVSIYGTISTLLPWWALVLWTNT